MVCKMCEFAHCSKMPAIIECLEQRSGLLKAIKEPVFFFGLEFLVQVFMLANEASQAMQNKNSDLAAATRSIDELKAELNSID